MPQMNAVSASFLLCLSPNIAPLIGRYGLIPTPQPVKWAQLVDGANLRFFSILMLKKIRFFIKTQKTNNIKTHICLLHLSVLFLYNTILSDFVSKRDSFVANWVVMLFFAFFLCFFFKIKKKFISLQRRSGKCGTM